MPDSSHPPGAPVGGASGLAVSIAPVETAIPAFIGYTEKAQEIVPGDLRNRPQRIASMVEFETFFGGPQPELGIDVTIDETRNAAGNTTAIRAAATLDEAHRSLHILHYSLQLFFANGGGPCTIVSVGDFRPVGSALVEFELHAGLEALAAEEEPTLLVCPEAQALSIADFKTLMDAALAQCAGRRNRFAILDLHGDVDLDSAASDLLAAVASFRSHGIGANHLSHGAVYGPNVETTLDFAYDPSTLEVHHAQDGTTAPLETLEASDPSRYRLAVAAIRDLGLKLPPSGALAGLYAATDRTRGVWEAAANLSLATVVRPTIPITDAEQEPMNIDAVSGKSVNAIRSFIGRGTLVWGARTLAGNDNEWRYVSVRRFADFVEASVWKATETFVFEPNDAATWGTMQRLIEEFLTALWRRGALQGARPEEAFFVAVGLGRTMTALDILEGRLIVEIGLAAVRPAEFILLRLSHKMAEA